MSIYTPRPGVLPRGLLCDQLLRVFIFWMVIISTFQSMPRKPHGTVFIRFPKILNILIYLGLGIVLVTFSFESNFGCPVFPYPDCGSQVHGGLGPRSGSRWRCALWSVDRRPVDAEE